MLFPNTVRWFNERKLENCLFSLRTGLRFVGTHTLPTTVTHSSHWLSLRVLWVRGVALCRASVYLYVFVDRMLHGTETPRLDAFLQICCLGLLGAFQEWYVVKNLMGKYQSFENVHKNAIILFFFLQLVVVVVEPGSSDNLRCHPQACPRTDLFPVSRAVRLQQGIDDILLVSLYLPGT